MSYKVVRRAGVIVACGPNVDEYQPFLEAGDVLSIEDNMPEIPQVVSCSAWQIRKALNALGLRQKVETAVADSTDQDLKDGWNCAQDFYNNDPFVLSMGTAIGKNPQEVTELISYAKTL